MPAPKSIKRLSVARTAWLVFVVLNIALLLIILPADFKEKQTLCPIETNCPVGINPDLAEFLNQTGISVTAYAVFQTLAEGAVLSAYWLAAILIYGSKSRNWFTLLVAFCMFAMGSSFLINDVLAQGLPPAFRWFYYLSGIFGLTFFFLFLYLFPDGRFVPRWAVMLVPLSLIFPLINRFWHQVAEHYLWPIPLILILGGFAAQIYRFKRVSNPEQRQQTKWVVYGAGIGFPILAALIAAYNFLSGFDLVIYYLFAQFLIALAFAIIPISITMAVLRYHLWDIDLIIRRTLQYTLLTGLLALVYFGSVVLLQSTFETLTGQGSPIVIVISTLGIAVLFNPLRLRIQRFIDRRFYRRKYDAEQTLAAFAAIARDEVDLEKLTASLIDAVAETMQPEQVSLWLRSAGK